MLNITFSFQLSCLPGGSAFNASIPITLQPYKDKTSAACSSKIAGFMGLGHRTFHLSGIIIIILLHLLLFLSLFSSTELCIYSPFSHCFIKISFQCSLLHPLTYIPDPLMSGPGCIYSRQLWEEAEYPISGANHQYNWHQSIRAFLKLRFSVIWLVLDRGTVKQHGVVVVLLQLAET